MEIDKNSGDVIITEGLLINQIFNIEDLQEIREGENIECYGHLKIFDQTFDETFE